MKKTRKIIYIILFISIFIIINILYENNNLRLLSLEDKNYLMELLEIKEANSFNPIRKKRCISGFGGSDPDYYEIVFEISIQDYEKNNMNYNEESFYEVFTDCTYKEKKDDNTYTCILRVSELNNKELFKKLNKLNKHLK